MSFDPSQFDRLPEWAQKEIRTLEIQIQSLQSRLDFYEGREETNTYLPRIPFLKQKF